MDHSLVSRVLTSLYEGRQQDLQHFRSNPLQAYLHVLAILNQIIAILRETRRDTLEVRLVCSILVQDCIIRFRRSAVRQGIQDAENRPQVLSRNIRIEPLTEDLLDKEFSDSD